MSDRHICIHGHFYQPPRENPWLEAIERQESAHPHHDWNARITAECYAPNAAARILDGEGRIARIVNNYSRISFNFGPTLLAWLEPHAPDTYAAILAADRASAARFGGHGSALAQAYGHLILPLANSRDRRTQVRWGIADFEHRFGRRPEGMWLPETAVDLETLELLAEAGIGFTILAPRQARRVRPLASGDAPDGEWTDVSENRIDRGRAYVQRLPSGAEIALFFYDGPLSQAVAFEGLLADGERFAERLTGAFVEGAEGPRIVHIATDGETYGHHFPRGEMGLAYALQRIEENGGAGLINYPAYLARYPPADEVEIVENSSWSCIHGVERWRSDCGCSSGGNPGWNQAWRAPLRAALDWLRDELAERYEDAAGELLSDPWAARDDYIEVILDRSDASRARFFARHAARPLDAATEVRALELLELQRHAMLMYTSCGWFFDDLSGIETVQVIQYADRALQLAEDLFGDRLQKPLVDRLAAARSNLPEKRDGRRVYETAVLPARVDLEKVAAHYAVTALFEPYAEEARVYCYSVDRQDEQVREAGRARLAIGRAEVASEITRERAILEYGALHLGDHNVVAGVRPQGGPDAYARLARDASQAFRRADFPAVIRLLDARFGAPAYSLRSLFRDQQQRVLERILDASVREASAFYEQLHDRRAPLLRFVAELGIDPPRAFRLAAEFVLNTRLRRALAPPADLDEATRLLEAAREEHVGLEEPELAYAAAQALEAEAAVIAERPADRDALERLGALVRFVRRLSFDVPLWSVQNTYHRVHRAVLPGVRERAQRDDEAASQWLETFERLGDDLSMALEPEESPEPVGGPDPRPAEAVAS